MRHLIVSACLSVSLIAAAQAESNPETLVERSQSNARAAIDRAVEALGGVEALRSIDAVRLRLAGEIWPRLQMPTPAPPFESGTFDETLLLDLKNNRLKLEQETSGAGFTTHNTILIQAGEGTTFDHQARTATPIPAAQATQQQFVQYYRRLPQLILRQALDRSGSLRYLGQDAFEGKSHDVVTFVMADTQQVAVYIDSATSLISKYELNYPDPLTGDDASELVFGEYTQGKTRVPQRWIQRLSGERASEFKLEAQINPTLSDELFQVDTSQFQSVAALPNELPQKVEKLGEGVFLLENVAGQNQNSLAVAFNDHILVVEAPGSSDGAETLIRRIKETIPGKPIRYVVATHHHGDHIGGLRAFIAEGATVITTKGNQQIVEAMAAAPEHDRLARSPRKPEFLFIERKKRVMRDASQTVELHDIGPNPHARELLIAYLPKEQLIFQGDMFNVPANEAPLGPPQASTESFAKRVDELALKVERIAGVHGRTATRAEFEKAIRSEK